jgi:peptide/nickel transport system ATP-binding protein
MTGDGVAVRGLTVALEAGDRIVEDLNLTIAPGEVLGVVGESGSGKTTLALGVLGYSRPGAVIVAGGVSVGGTELPYNDPKAVRRLRGRLMSYVPQDPGNSLNPALRIERSIRFALEAARRDGGAQDVAEALRLGNLPSNREFQRRFPHQLSGGQQQRVLLGMALGAGPTVIVFDEPTTGLDVVTQARILAEIQTLRSNRLVAMLYVSHDLAVVSQVADRIAVMYAGHVVEVGPAQDVISSPRHPYTRGLLACCPDVRTPRRLAPMPGVAVGVGERPPGCPFSPRCPYTTPECDRAVPSLFPTDSRTEARCIRWEVVSREAVVDTLERRLEHASFGDPILQINSVSLEFRVAHGRARVVHDATFDIRHGECLAVVGESGSGKTTLARCVAGLHPPTSGLLKFDGLELAGRAGDRPRETRRRIQIVFQNPYDSLNPRQTVRQIIARPIEYLRGIDSRDARQEVLEFLARVRIPRRLADRYPGELSGGERQRIAIARALAAHPDLIVCDEITSALDVSVQAAILDLLLDLQTDLSLSLMFISHDLGVVRSLADRVLVLETGRIVEQGTVESVIATPTAAYTKTLIDAAPRIAVATQPPSAAP